MHVFAHISEIKTFLKEQRANGKSVGLVPTMGALHSGHLSLIEAAINENDLTVASIFVNPAQFNNASDLEKYPRTLQNDLDMLEEAGCSVVFTPSSSEMYPSSKPGLSIAFDGIDEVMEGEFRPGHFSGVGVIVAKFFNIISPDRAYFGQKDLQQFFVIERLVKSLNFDLELRRMPIVRESSGLAMSSRNRRLTEDQTDRASTIYKALQEAGENIKKSEDLITVNKIVETFISSAGMKLEYFHVIDVETFSILRQVGKKKPLALCIAAFMGEVRLIDNLLLE